MKKTSVFLEELLNQILQEQPNSDYAYLASVIKDRVEQGLYQPIKASGLNGKKPPLYNRYWVLSEEEDYSELQEELKFSLHPMISIDYYMKHLVEYQQNRDYVKRLSEYLKYHKDRLKISVATNERSFDIFGNEKYIDEFGGRELIKKCGLDAVKLNFYETSIPLAYYKKSSKSPQKILIIENKDTFYSMRRYLENNDKILGIEFETLIYGGGKGVFRAFADYVNGAEKYFMNPDNELLYFGDLDYEGIGIYEKLCDMYPAVTIKLFVKAYCKMLKKSADRQQDLALAKIKQNRNVEGFFFEAFNEDTVHQMRKILEEGKYIPQEILNESDY